MLANIQDKIFRSLLALEKEEIGFIKSYNDIPSVERLLIHRQTILENFLDNLRISYPGVWKLLGQECAQGAGLAYIHNLANIPSAGKMAEFGANFAEHLKNFPSTKDLLYLPDFAKLEWLRSLCFDAPSETFFDPAQLTEIDPNELNKCKFIFSSSVFFMKSAFPLLKIQELLEEENDASIDLQLEETYICVYRFEGKVNTAWLNKANWYFLKALSEGRILEEAVENGGVDLEEMLRFIFTRRIVVKLSLLARSKENR